MFINIYFICSSKISCIVSEVSGMFLRCHQGDRSSASAGGARFVEGLMRRAGISVARR